MPRHLNKVFRSAEHAPAQAGFNIVQRQVRPTLVSSVTEKDTDKALDQHETDIWKLFQ